MNQHQKKFGKNKIYCFYFNRKVSIPSKATNYLVKLNIHNKLICDCEESIFEGMPFRHELCIYIKEMKPLLSFNIHKRWTFGHFDKSILPDVSEKEDETEKTSDDSENELECQSPIDKSLSNDLDNEDENETDNEEPEQVKPSISVCLILD